MDRCNVVDICCLVALVVCVVALHVSAVKHANER